MEASHRLHALDNIRAHMMLLGVVFHSAINYSTGEPNADWPFRDQATDGFFSVVVNLIHVFRMPVFFIVAGFFTALLIKRRSISGLFTNRIKRILVPLLLFLLPTIWLCSEGFTFVNAQLNGDAFSWSSLNELAHVNLFHLWFLYYLLFFYVMLSLPWKIIESFPSFQEKLALLNNKLWHKHAPIAFGVITGVVLFLSGRGQAPAPVHFIPDVSVLLYYFGFFVGGSALYNASVSLKDLPSQNKYWFVLLVVSMVGYVASELIVLSPEALENKTYSLHGALFQGVFTWSLCLLIVNAYVKYANNASAFGRYFTDASYWIYLIHLPITIWLPIGMADWAAGPWTKFLICLSVTTVVTVVSYHLFVRSTFIGSLLNGRRYPFRLFGA